jgi:hypothetical protein
MKLPTPNLFDLIASKPLKGALVGLAIILAGAAMSLAIIVVLVLAVMLGDAMMEVHPWTMFKAIWITCSALITFGVVYKKIGE